MTKFETIGVNYQYAADSKREAQKSFAYSCKTCCNKGMHLDCDRCAIAHTHAMVLAYFSDKEMQGEQHKINEEASA